MIKPALLLCLIVQATPAMLGGLSIHQGGREESGRWSREAYDLASRCSRQTMRIRGGGVGAVETASTPGTTGFSAYSDLLAGDLAQLNHLGQNQKGVSIDARQLRRLKSKHKRMSEKVRLTEMFLILQNARVER